jgi:hypothetical protein
MLKVLRGTAGAFVLAALGATALFGVMRTPAGAAAQLQPEDLLSIVQIPTWPESRSSSLRTERASPM